VDRKCWNEQIDLLTMILALANKIKKPVVLHLRNMGGPLGREQVYETALELCSSYLDSTHRIYLHCFMGSYSDGMRWRGRFPHCFFGYCPKLVSARLSWRTALEVRSTTAFFKEVEFDRVLLESDAPYQALDKHPMSPHLTYYVALDLSKLLHIPIHEVARRTAANALDFYAEK
jgi:Tat protein secretion system quality control protein TatD with DNase activity